MDGDSLRQSEIEVCENRSRRLTRTLKVEGEQSLAVLQLTNGVLRYDSQKVECGKVKVILDNRHSRHREKHSEILYTGGPQTENGASKIPLTTQNIACDTTKPTNDE